MGELILCRGTLAAVPYFLESIAVNIYSLEELAWCMDQHAELTGIDIYKESFAGWVKEELGLADEGQTLFDLLAGKKDMAEFTDTVLKMVSYLDEEQRRRVLSRIKAYEDKSLFEQEILKADRFLMSGKYKSSIRAYEPLTEHVPENRREEVLLGRVWHNMGTAYARLFMFARTFLSLLTKKAVFRRVRSLLLSPCCLRSRSLPFLRKGLKSRSPAFCGAAHARYLLLRQTPRHCFRAALE